MLVIISLKHKNHSKFGAKFIRCFNLVNRLLFILLNLLNSLSTHLAHTYMDFLDENQLFSYQSQPSSPIKSNNENKSKYIDCIIIMILFFIVLSKSPQSILDTNSIIYPDNNANDNGHTENNIILPMKSDTKAERSITAKSESETKAWSRNEIFKFFLLYKKYYKDFQAISINLNSRTKDQVRQFYYRLVTKITTMLLKYGYISEELKIKEKNVYNLSFISYSIFIVQYYVTTMY